MIGIELDATVVMQQKGIIEAALMDNPDTAERIQKIIRRAILLAREDVVAAAGNAMKSDPRRAAEAIRTSVYKQILGAQINIYNSKKAHGRTSYEPPRTLVPGQRGGNRRRRGEKTERIMSYAGHDRGFILRFINEGTGVRGNRGSISARKFFMGAAQAAIEKAIENISIWVDQELSKILLKK